ncbi:MAG: DUF1622 domain-containing protein [Congregibacter sp.]
MEHLTPPLEIIAGYIDLFGISIILYGFVVSAIGLIRAEFDRLRLRCSAARFLEVRTQLGGYILAGIEFMIASDIINTVLSRELMDLAFVSALVLIRTAISFFLGREIRELEELSRSNQPKLENP